MVGLGAVNTDKRYTPSRSIAVNTHGRPLLILRVINQREMYSQIPSSVMAPVSMMTKNSMMTIGFPKVELKRPLKLPKPVSPNIRTPNRLGQSVSTKVHRYIVPRKTPNTLTPTSVTGPKGEIKRKTSIINMPIIQ